MLTQPENEDVRLFENHWIHPRERTAWQEGKQEGRQEGVQEGRKEGIQRVVLSLLEQRFGSVPDAVRRRVKALESPDDLTRLAGRVSTADSLAELGLDG